MYSNSTESRFSLTPLPLLSPPETITTEMCGTKMFRPCGPSNLTTSICSSSLVLPGGRLFPEKINVSFAKLKSDNHIVLNVWERGAGKTNACGTAACATTVAGVEMGLIKNKVTVTLPGGDLEIYYKSNDNIIMTGPTEINFTDKYKL